MRFWKLFFCLCLGACQTSEKKDIIPAITPASGYEKQIKIVRPENIIGAVEPFYILPMKSTFFARIDTGATTSSIDVKNLKRFERDGKRFVAFDITNEASGETHHFEKKILKRIRITRFENEQDEHRLKVMMDIKFGGEKMSKEFTLAERNEFKYQGLIGRNILTGRYIVDTSVSNTLK